MMLHKCPGMNPRSWTSKDVREQPCRCCGHVLEFWKDDVKVECSECGGLMFNPNLANICLAWCARAAECLGSMDIEEWKRQHLACGNDSVPQPSASGSK